MSKSIKRALSLLLALTMVLSLGLPAYAVGVPEDDIAITEEPAVKTANLPIGAGKQPGIIPEDEIISDDLIVDIVDEETVAEETAAPAKTFTYSESATGFSVEVSAPTGALPLGTEMVVDRLVDLTDVQAAVDSADNLDGEVQLAADISFWHEGKEIEPAEGSKLLVRMSAPEIEGIADPIVIHVPDGENAVPEIVEQMSADNDLVLVNTVEFEAEDFSVYAVIGEVIIEDEEGTIDFESEDYTVTVSYTKEAKIPAGTKLTVSEIPYGTDEYFELRAAAQEKLNENIDFSSERDISKARGIADAIFVDVSLEYNGKPFEPAVPLDVKITLNHGALFCPAGEETVVVHFGDKETELIEDVAVGLSAYEVPNGMPEGLMLNSFDYEQNGFSAVGLISTDDFIDFEKAVPAETLPSAAELLASIVKAAGDPSINAGKTVTDANGDGVYELALSVQATSKQSSDTKAQKSNVVMIIDVSGSMEYYTYYDSYTYDAATYNNFIYYNSNSGTNNTQLYYGRFYDYNSYSYKTGWYYRDGWGDSYSYTGPVYAYETRLQATQRAACAVVDALLAYNTNQYNIKDMFEITVVKFAERTAYSGYNGTETVIKDSTDATAIKNAINGLKAAGGTHWRAALEQGLAEANYFKNTDPSRSTDPVEKTSVIFLTDGFPTEYGTGNDGGSENNGNVSHGYRDARDPARDIVAGGFTLYNIFAFGNDTTTWGNTSGQYNTGSHTGFQFLCGLANYAYGSGDTDNFSTTTNEARQYCFNAKSTDDLLKAFKTIIDHITNNVGFAGVNFTDGVSLGATSTSVAVNGTAKADSMRYTVKDETGKIAYTVKFNTSGAATFTIYNADGTTTVLTDSAPETVTTTINGNTINSQVYSVTVGEGENAKTYKMSPATIDANTGMVKWDLAGLGILESGYTYTVAFDVWPNQTAYDIAADLNNGIYPDIDAALTAYKITDATERQHIKDAIVKNADGSYELYTNYEQSVEYYPATETTDGEGNTTWTYGDKATQDVPQPDPVPLKGSKLKLVKAWESNLSPNEYNELLWVDGKVGGTSKEYKITLYVWKADTEAALMDLVEEGDISKAYITKTLGWDETVEGTDKYVWEKDAAVAPGMMLNVDAAKQLGYDVTDQTKLREFTNDQGKTLTYYVIESGHYYYVTEEGSDLHFELQTVLYHPMIVDGTLYNVSFGEGKTVEKMDPMKAVTATNTLKGGLNISKVVTGEDKTTEVKDPETGLKTCEDEFTFKITIWKEDEEGNKTPVYTTDDQIDTSEATPKTISGSVGYRIFAKPTGFDEHGDVVYDKNAQKRGAVLAEDSEYADLANGVFAEITSTETTITLTMPANGEIRLVNLPAGTHYKVEEILDSANTSYQHFKTVHGVKTGSGITEDEPVTNIEVSGEVHGNMAAVETFYNWAASFYVYHSADNTIEKISFADNRVKGEYDEENSKYTYTFNIAKETKDHYIYGGYYKDFADKGTFDVTTAPFVKATEAVATTYDGEHKDGYWFKVIEGSPAPYRGDASKWTPAQAYTENGTAMEPKANTVYFLKEVPDAFIRIALRYTYYLNSTYDVGTVWLVCAIDGDVDNGYKDFGLMNYEDGSVIANVKAEDGMPKAVIAGAEVNFTAKTTQTSVKVDASDLITKMGDSFFDTNKGPYTGNVAYITVRDKSIYGNSDSGMIENLITSEQKTVLFFVTPDNVQVTSARVASVKNINGVASKGEVAKRITLQKFGLRDNSEELSTYISTLTYVPVD